MRKLRDGDIYLELGNGDLWIARGNSYIRINNGISVNKDFSSYGEFERVGHVDNLYGIGFFNRLRVIVRNILHHRHKYWGSGECNRPELYSVNGENCPKCEWFPTCSIGQIAVLDIFDE